MFRTPSIRHWRRAVSYRKPQISPSRKKEIWPGRSSLTQKKAARVWVQTHARMIGHVPRSRTVIYAYLRSGPTTSGRYKWFSDEGKTRKCPWSFS